MLTNQSSGHLTKRDHGSTWRSSILLHSGLVQGLVLLKAPIDFERDSRPPLGEQILDFHLDAHSWINKHVLMVKAPTDFGGIYGSLCVEGSGCQPQTQVWVWQWCFFKHGPSVRVLGTIIHTIFTYAKAPRHFFYIRDYFTYVYILLAFCARGAQ